MGFNLLQFAVGTILLYFGAELLITGSKSIADKFNFVDVNNVDAIQEDKGSIMVKINKQKELSE